MGKSTLIQKWGLNGDDLDPKNCHIASDAMKGRGLRSSWDSAVG